MDQQNLTANQFGASAANYLTSAIHSHGEDLERIAALCKVLQARRALDLGSGAGHASFALARGGAEAIVAYDLSQAMLNVVAVEAAARAHDMIETQVGAVESLPFADASFDLIVTRYSAHHWMNVARAMRETARVLTPNGSLVIIDVISPEPALLDTSLQVLELLRDASHVRDYRISEWRTVLTAAGFGEPAMQRWRLPMQFQDWITRIATPPERVKALEAVFDGLPREVLDHFEVASDHSFSIDAAWLQTQLRS